MSIESGQSLVFVTSGGERMGCAFFVDETHLLTCAHVVASCFDVNVREGDLRDRIIECEFFTGAELRWFTTKVKIYRRALAWRSGTSEEQRLSDIAVLSLTTPPADLPLQPRPVRFGAPTTSDKVVCKGAVPDEDGIVDIATGQVIGPLEEGRYYVRVDPGSKVRPGYSGGPVVVMAEDAAAIGMVQRAPQKGGDARFISSRTIRDALKPEFDLAIPDSKAAALGPSVRNVDDTFINELLKIKNRDGQEKEILDRVKGSARDKKLVVAVLPAPDESCPDIFRDRLADPAYARQPHWGQRTTWGVDWPTPVFSLDDHSGGARIYAKKLEELFEAAYAPNPPDVPDDPAKLRVALVKRFALLPIKVTAGSRAKHNHLRDEIEAWARAHEKAGRPVFCVLLILETQHQRGMFALFKRATNSATPDEELARALSDVAGVSLALLKPLRPLEAGVDLAPWIERSSRAFKSYGHEPRIIQQRVLQQTYDGDELQKISFFRWSLRLDEKATTIFARREWN